GASNRRRIGARSGAIGPASSRRRARRDRLRRRHFLEAEAGLAVALDRGAQLLDLAVEDAVIVGIVDRAVDQVDAGRIQALVEQAGKRAGAVDAMAAGAIALGIFDEVGVAVGEAPVGKAHIGLLPADHAIGIVAQ